MEILGFKILLIR